MTKVLMAKKQRAASLFCSRPPAFPNVPINICVAQPFPQLIMNYSANTSKLVVFVSVFVLQLCVCGRS